MKGKSSLEWFQIELVDHQWIYWKKVIAKTEPKKQ